MRGNDGQSDGRRKEKKRKIKKREGERKRKLKMREIEEKRRTKDTTSSE